MRRLGVRPCTAAFDRGSLVAVRPADREAYASVVGALMAPGGRVLLVTVEHAGLEGGRPGPPFSVSPAQVRALFERDFVVELLHREDQADEWRSRGVHEFHEAAFLLTRRQGGSE